MTKIRTNKICKFVATTSRYLRQGSECHHFQKNAYNSKTMRLLLKKKKKKKKKKYWTPYTLDEFSTSSDNNNLIILLPETLVLYQWYCLQSSLQAVILGDFRLNIQEGIEFATNLDTHFTRKIKIIIVRLFACRRIHLILLYQFRECEDFLLGSGDYNNNCTINTPPHSTCKWVDN